MRPNALKTLLCLCCLSLLALTLATAEEPKLSEDVIRQFLLTAKVTDSKQISKGITSPWRLTLTDGTLTHDAAFQAVDERKTTQTFASGRTEMNFRDSYHFNIAAYELSKMVGLDYMMPVTVERKWQGKTGALSWWITWKWDEAMRIKEKIQPPDPDAWNKQMHRMRVFSELVYDTDRNLGNVLITEDWHLRMIDFTRAFRISGDLFNAKNLEKFDRGLLEKIKALTAENIEARCKPHLGKAEVKAIIQRRDKIVAIAAEKVAKNGETVALY